MSNSLSSTEYEMRLFFAARETTVRCLSLANATGENSGNCDGFAVGNENNKKCQDIKIFLLEAKVY